jgi:oligopeptide transport system substrate-binding protein
MRWMATGREGAMRGCGWTPVRRGPTCGLAGTLAIAAVVIGSAWGATIPAGTVLHARQEFVRSNGSEPESLDPALIESVVANNIVVDLFEGLTARDNSGKLVPGVAESWQQTTPVTWLFHLRKDARWSNGQPVTADDFVYGWRRFLDPGTASAVAATLGTYIANGMAVVKGARPLADLGIKALDQHTLQVTTATPVPFLPEVVSVASFDPLPRAVIEKYGRDWTKPGNLVGNGAYTLKEWQVNSKVVVEKSPTYWDAAHVVLTRVTYLPIEDGNADLKLYQSGETEMVLQLPPGTFEAVKAQYPEQVHNNLILGLRFHDLNTRDPLLQDVRVRKALSMVIDRDLLATKITADGQRPVYGLILEGLAGADVTRYDWADWPMDRRVAEARRLLAEAGVKPGTKIRFTYNNSEYHKKMAIFAAAEWKTSLGLETEMESLEFRVLLRRRRDGEFQIARNGWGAAFNDATIFLTLLECESDANDSRSCNRHADELVQQGNLSADPVRRKALLTEAARLMMDDYPMIPLLQYSTPRLLKPYVGGYSDANALDRFRSKDFYIVKH